MGWRIRIARRFPLTLFGFLLSAAGFYFFAQTWREGNLYALVAGTFIFAFLMIVGTIGFLQALRFADQPLLWDSAQPIYARIGGDQIFHAGDKRAPYFFRFHASMRGRLQIGRDVFLHFYGEASASDTGDIRVPVQVPAGGPLDVRAEISVRDIFGCFRFRAGLAEKRKLIVLPPIFSINADEHPDSVFTEENLRKRKDSDAEKFYMREYIPGDRIKDINWKVSMRLMELITRISPVSSEDSFRLRVVFRPYCRSDMDDIAMIMHLNYAKSLVLSYMRAVKRMRSGADFLFRYPGGELSIETEADIDSLAVVLAGEFFHDSEGPSFRRDEAVGGEIVFTTAYDEGLMSYLQSRPGVRYQLYRTVWGDSGRKTRKIPFFNRFNPDILPGLWFLRRMKPPVSLHRVPEVVLEEPIAVRRI